ncbi:helix-turn-helix domain-containing protein [Spirosoma fluminis]
MKSSQLQRINTITEYHQLMGLPKPQHPLISVVRFDALKRLPAEHPNSIMYTFYSIVLKRNFMGKMKYGQQAYDFDQGVMLFLAPGQVFSIESDETVDHSGWLLFVHPDFLWNTPLAKVIRQYAYFSYSVSEALYLSEREEAMVTGIIETIEQEYHSAIDAFSPRVIIAQLELLLIYADRFYNRQFLTRTITNHKILDRLEAILADYFNSDALVENGLPTVQSIAETLNVSPNYLSSLLKVSTGQSTQQHIHDKLIEKAKEKLSTTDLSISEIAYALGFEHSQSFSKLFKSKTAISPVDFRRSFT